jgi:serine/threonine protein kinase
LGLLFFLVVRRQRRGYSELSDMFHKQEKLLATSRHELENLRHVFDVEPEDIALEARIDKGSEGAFGEVWRATWHERTVAVKKLRASLLELDPLVFGDFEKEMNLLRVLRHKNIVLFYGAGIMGETPYLVLEYCERGSLYTVLHDPAQELSLARCRQFVLDVAQGMAFLHGLSPPKIHRDLKSANLLVTASYAVKIGDFGTARQVDSLTSLAPSRSASISSARFGTDADLTTHGMFSCFQLVFFDANICSVGTIRWSAPEVLVGSMYGLRADVYSFAMVMYEIYTRQVPFHTLTSVHDVRIALRAHQRPDVPTNMPPAMTVLMIQCWANLPAERPSFANIVVRIEGTDGA